MKRRHLIAFFLLPLVGEMYGQILESPKTMQSPNTASLGLYGEIPVSHFTGTPSISVPLYELKIGNSSLPLSLNYHAAGIRPDQHPGWTGLGWSLDAGGAISRVVYDMADDYNNSNYYMGGNSGFYFNYAALAPSNWNQKTYLRQVAQSDGMLKDTEPDQFSFHFCGINGKFILNHQRKWEVQCDRPIKVEFDDTYIAIPFRKEGTRAQKFGYSKSFSGFTLTTEDGIRYIFGGTTDAIEYSVDFFRQAEDDWIATSWYLTKIIYADGREVSFSYTRGDFVNQMYIAVHHDLGSSAEGSGGLFNLDPECSSWSVTSIDASYEGQLISPVYLKTMTAEGVKISFVREETSELRYENKIYNYRYSYWANNPDGYSFLVFLQGQNPTVSYYPDCLDNLKWYKLSEIRICNDEEELIRSFRFSYTDTSTRRLTLDSISEHGYGAVGRSYRFEYESPELLPVYLSNKVDHWGFYNGRIAALNYSSYYADREAVASCLQYGILKKIHWPTGGYTRFVFEPHTYRKQTAIKRWEDLVEYSVDKTAGGLRIKQIINSSIGKTAEEVVSKEYFYTSDYLQNGSSNASSGILGGQIQYSFSDYTVRAFNDNDVRRKMSMFSSQSVLPCCENSVGNHIGYTEVVEKQGDGSFTRYRYTNFDNGHKDDAADAVIQETRTPYEPYSSRAIERGCLILQEEYTVEGTLKRKKEITYGRSSDNFVRTMKARYRNVCPNTAVSYDEGTVYRIYTYNYRPAQEIETLYNNLAYPVRTTVNYTYDSDGLPESISRTANGGMTRIEYKRPRYYNTGVYGNMVSFNIISPVIEETKKMMEESGIVKNLERIQYDYVQLDGSSDRKFAIKSVRKAVGDAALKEIYVCNRFDSRGNAVHTIEKGKNAVVLWGYGSRYPVASIEGATYTDVENWLTATFISSLADDIITVDSKLESLRNTLFSKNVIVTTYTYNPLVGMTSKTTSNGVTTYYVYDSIGRLQQNGTYEHNGAKEIIKVFDYHYKNQ